jgi:type III restriction enzyme
VPELPPVKRALRLAGALTLQDDIDPHALDEARDRLVGVLVEEMERALAADRDYVTQVRRSGELEVSTLSVAVGTSAVREHGRTRVPLTAENVDDLFARCGRALGVGEGLHKEFWKRVYDGVDPLYPKLLLHEMLKDGRVLHSLAYVAESVFEQQYSRNKKNISGLHSSRQTHYNRLIGSGREPAVIARTMPAEIQVRNVGETLRHHLYSDAHGQCILDLNSWERTVLAEESERSNFVAWLRNTARKEWAIAVPYDDRGVKAFFPDFVFVRREHGELVADLIDPHNSKMDDTWSKVKGLAIYADRHGTLFGRLEVAIVEKGGVKRINVNDPSTRKLARELQSNNDIDALYR